MQDFGSTSVAVDLLLNDCHSLVCQGREKSHLLSSLSQERQVEYLILQQKYQAAIRELAEFYKTPDYWHCQLDSSIELDETTLTPQKIKEKIAKSDRDFINYLRTELA